MSKRKNIEADLFTIGLPESEIKSDIEYPLCLKSHDGKRYWRYLQDGRFEFIEINRFNSTLQFGIYKNTLKEIIDEDNFYFKVLRFRNIKISIEEFDGMKVELINNYSEYLKNEKYQISETQEKQKEEIITNEQPEEEDPF